MNTFQLVRLGIRYERAMQSDPRDWDAIIKMEHIIDQEQNRSENWITPWIVHGRNKVLEQLGKALVRA